MARLRPAFPKSHDQPHVDDLRVLSGMIVFNRNGLRCTEGMRTGQDRLQALEALEVRGKRQCSECSHEHGIFARIMVARPRKAQTRRRS